MKMGTREEVLKLMDEKDRLEDEIKQLNSVLSKNGVGINEPLVDNEGFPLNNIDIYQVRHARHLIICKQNDHKELMKRIERGLHDYYGPGTINNVPKQTNSSTHAPHTNIQIIHKIPFAKINTVSQGSPSDIAGLKINDELVEFGSVNSENFKNLSDIGTVVFHSEGIQIKVKVKRGHNYIVVNLVPRKWSGNGLLGCNVIPLEIVLQ